MTESVKADKVQTISSNLPECVTKVAQYVGDGYVVDGVPFKVGFTYYVSFILPEKVEEEEKKKEAEKLAKKADEIVVADGDPESVTTPKEEAEKMAETTDSDVISAEEAKALRPDWDKVQKMVDMKDKEGIEAEGRKFGCELDKRKSPKNMMVQFKELCK